MDKQWDYMQQVLVRLCLNPLKQVKSFGPKHQPDQDRPRLSLNPLKQVKSFGLMSNGDYIVQHYGSLNPLKQVKSFGREDPAVLTLLGLKVLIP